MRFFFLLVSVCIFSSCDSLRQDNQYQLTCLVFDEVKEEGIALTPEVLLERLEKKVGKESDAYVAWQGLVNFEASERYNIFKVTVEEVTGSEWNCESMKLLAPTWE